MNLYFDSSALVKRFIREAESADVIALTKAAALLGTCRVAEAEVHSAISRAVRSGNIPVAAAARAREAFTEGMTSLVWISVDADLAHQAGDLAWRHALRGFDAIHLAAGREWASTLGGAETLFATFDKQLARAARAEGLNVWPEGD